MGGWTPNQRMMKAICTNLLGSVTSENAQRSYGCACAFRKHLSLKVLTYLVLPQRWFWG